MRIPQGSLRARPDTAVIRVSATIRQCRIRGDESTGVAVGTRAGGRGQRFEAPICGRPSPLRAAHARRNAPGRQRFAFAAAVSAGRRLWGRYDRATEFGAAACARRLAAGIMGWGRVVDIRSGGAKQYCGRLRVVGAPMPGGYRRGRQPFTSEARPRNSWRRRRSSRECGKARQRIGGCEGVARCVDAS